MIDAAALARYPELTTECWCGDDHSVHGKGGCYKGTCQCQAYVPRLAAPRMLELLRELQWGDHDEGAPCCPECVAFREPAAGPPRPGFGLHDDNCRLGRLLTELGADKP